MNNMKHVISTSPIFIAFLIIFLFWGSNDDSNNDDLYYLEDVSKQYNDFDINYEQSNDKKLHAQNNLGNIYRDGIGVTKNYEKAVIWYRESAEEGNFHAQNNLGNMYRNGMGVIKDYKEAVFWYHKSAEQGLPSAQDNLGSMYRNGMGVKKNNQTAASWYRESAEQGHPLAENNLALMYEQGLGVNKNPLEALRLYRSSAAQGNSLAQKKLELLKIKMEIKNCKTKLFGIAIKCTNRDELMVSIKKSGATVKREDKSGFSDIYYTKNLFKESSELTTYYTSDGSFAMAKYVFPSLDDAEQVTRVKNLISRAYGESHSSIGEVSSGGVIYRWNLEDGVELKISRGWPNTTTYLYFTVPEKYYLMISEQNKSNQ